MFGCHDDFANPRPGGHILYNYVYCNKREKCIEILPYLPGFVQLLHDLAYFEVEIALGTRQSTKES